MEYTDDGFGSFGGIIYDDIDVSEADAIIQGIPFDSAASARKGAKFGPVQMRLLSVDMQLTSRTGINLENMVVRDMGNIPIFTLDDSKTRENIENYNTKLLDSTKAPIISLGGDHSCTYPLLKSYANRGKVAILWFDAHRDILPILDGSKFSHGCPLGRALELPNVNPENVLLIGTRYMEQSEQKVLEEYNIPELRMVDLERDNFNMEQFRERVIKITENVDYIYVSIDIDVLDPAFAPGTGTPVGGGMTTSQLMKYIDALPIKVNAYDIMEISPPYDQSDITVKASLGILSEILAQIEKNKE